MFEKLREVSGFEPVKEANGAYTPSPSSLKVAAPKKTDYDHATYANALTDGKRRVLVICTEEEFLTTANGDRFGTGNHPVELFVVLLHLEKAGFVIDLATIDGKPVPIETWAMPTEDKAVMAIADRYKERLKSPLSLKKDIADQLGTESDYVAVYIPGGHGATLGLPESPEVAAVLRWVLNTERHLISICHGPSAFLSMTEGEKPGDFPLAGYHYAGFPDVGDRLMASIGYLPGPMPWFFNEKLEGLGMTNVSKLPVGKTHVDRRLITGDGPTAANALGGLAARHLLEVYGS